MEPAREHEWARKHLGWLDPGQDGFARISRQFELDWSLGLALDDRYALSDAAIFDKVGHRQFDQIIAAQLAVNSDVEQSQIAQIAGQIQSGPDRRDLFGKQRPFLADDPPLVPTLAP